MKFDLSSITEERLFMNARNAGGALAALALAGLFVARAVVELPLVPWVLNLTASVFLVFIVLLTFQVTMRATHLSFLHSDRRERIDERPRYTYIKNDIKRPRMLTAFYFGLLITLLYIADMWFFGGPILILVVVFELLTDLAKARMDSLVYDKLSADDGDANGSTRGSKRGLGF